MKRKLIPLKNRPLRVLAFAIWAPENKKKSYYQETKQNKTKNTSHKAPLIKWFAWHFVATESNEIMISRCPLSATRLYCKCLPRQMSWRIHRLSHRNKASSSSYTWLLLLLSTNLPPFDSELWKECILIILAFFFRSLSVKLQASSLRLQRKQA